MNVVIYARFSSHSQNEQSIEGQLKTCYEFARKQGYTVIAEYIDRALSETLCKKESKSSVCKKQKFCRQN